MTPARDETGSPDSPMPVVGYSDKLSVQPGGDITFMISCDSPVYQAQLVRLLSNDLTPQRDGPKTEELDAPLNGEHPGKREKFLTGSYVQIPMKPALRQIPSFTIEAWIYPTSQARGRQAILSWVDEASGTACGLFIDGDGRLTMRLVDEKGSAHFLENRIPLRRKTWYSVACTHDASLHNSVLYQRGMREWPGDESTEVQTKVVPSDVGLRSGEAPILIAAAHENGPGTDSTDHFNGKIDAPKLFSRALTMRELESLRLGMPSSAYENDLVAAWDFSADISSTQIADSSRHGLHGQTVNNPKRAVTGHNWTGREVDFRKAPDQYGAIYFHEDDLEDAKWETDFTFRVPGEFRSGVYAIRLRSGASVDYIPFFVRSRRGAPQAEIAFLVPTLTYLAYSSFHSYAVADLAALQSMGTAYPVRNFERYSVQNRLVGLYDLHSDGSGVSFVSRLKPILTLRPNFVGAHLSSGRGAPHLFSADLILLDWLKAKGFEYDVITDEDLHHEGTDILRPYRVVLTGSHPEYYTENMLNSFETYLNGGGRLMYLGGNGFYWVTSIDPERPHIAEIRRWGGMQGWRSEAGEYYHSTTGEMGGTWRNRGRAPQRLVGVGYAAEGVDENRPYRRMPESFDPKVAFIFEGIGKDELIGDFENLVLNHGAAGFEVDRLDFGLGTPPNAKLLATSTRFADSYLRAIDELDTMDVQQTGSVNPKVRADMVLVDYPNGGAVFSVGSISWCGCLPQNAYDNNVSRITENVLSRFASDTEPV
jgi:N,N-dimethylformamidase